MGLFSSIRNSVQNVVRAVGRGADDLRRGDLSGANREARAVGRTVDDDVRLEIREGGLRGRVTDGLRGGGRMLDDLRRGDLSGAAAEHRTIGRTALHDAKELLRGQRNTGDQAAAANTYAQAYQAASLYGSAVTACHQLATRWQQYLMNHG